MPLIAKRTRAKGLYSIRNARGAEVGFEEFRSDAIQFAARLNAHQSPFGPFNVYRLSLVSSLTRTAVNKEKE